MSEMQSGTPTNESQKTDQQTSSKENLPPRTPQSTIIHNQVAELLTETGSSPLPKPDDLLKFVADREGEGFLVEVLENKVVNKIGERQLKAYVESYFKDLLCLKYPKYAYPKHTDIDATAKHVLNVAERLDSKNILSIAQKQHDGYAYEKLSFTLDSQDKCPTFDKIFERIPKNGDAIKAFIGSLMEPKSDRSQLVYLHGARGGEGKSEFIEFFDHVFKTAHTITKIPQDTDRFWESGIFNKRIITIPEMDAIRALMSERIKTITGNKVIHVEERGKTAYTAHTSSKFFVLSNKKPKVKNQWSNERRIIFARIEPYKGPVDPEYQEKLRAEDQAFMSMCWRKYKELCPKGGPIPVDPSAFAELVDASTFSQAEIFDQYFFTDPDIFVSQIHVERLFKAHNLGDSKGYKVADFMEYLVDNQGVEHKNRKVKTDGGEEKQKFAFWGVGIQKDYIGSAGYGERDFLRPAGSEKSDKEWLELRDKIGLARLGSGNGGM